ncbi:MAG: M1 family metallopeptidase [Candidatus Pacebacteria bacterium]|nr:M1 family metallopeptidase [Candidatus Paceibacterota bacterium]
MAKKSVRLSPDVIPQKYDLHLQPDFTAFTFEGSETIHIQLKKPTKSITLHAIELEITSAQALVKNRNTTAYKISYDKKKETVTLQFKDSLPKGAIALNLAFRGILNDRMHGFYRSSYVVDGKTKYLATTQFESNDARRAFPCFDEPAQKAIFEVSLTAPAEYEIVSNTIDVETQLHPNGTKTVKFEPSPKMSTYLLAFIVGELEHVERHSEDGVLVRVFTTPGKKHQAEFALDCAAKVISFFNAYFDIPYPLPVLDLIAIPDFAAGAMENWGAITYRESALLVDPEHSSRMNKQWVALVIGHEIAHQWFGNLVTMEWWTHLWLNEGFASYIEYLAVDHLFPEWDIWTQFLDADFGRALYADGLKHTHPIEVEVHDPAEIAVVFDAVSYSKGSSIIRMLAEYLGEEAFRDGLRHYLKQHSYGNTETEDLWHALEHVSGKPVAAMMAKWTAKAGYPLLTISEKNASYEIRQSRFFASPISEKETLDSTAWSVPLSIVKPDGVGHAGLMTARTTRIPKGNEAWIKVNANETAFHRTLYPEQMLAAFEGPIKNKQLHTRDRLGLIRDVLEVTETGKLSSVHGMAFVRHFVDETEYVVWTQIASGLAKLRSLVAREPFSPAFDAYALGIFAGIGKQLGWDAKPKDHAQALLKVLVLESLGRYGDKKVIAHAKALFAKVSEKKNPIPADLRGVVYATVARHGTKADYAKLLRLYKASTLHEEKNRIGRALGLFSQKELLQKTLEFSISSGVRSQDCVRMIGPVSVNPNGRDLAWRFVKKNWGMFIDRYTGTRELSYLLEPFGVAASQAWASEIKQFLKKHPAPGTERTVQQVLERIYSNTAWLARDKTSIRDFLKRN